MTNRADTKTRLASEIARIVFAEHILSSAAWMKIDALVEENFGDWSDNRRQGLIDDVAKMRACFDDCAPEDIDGPSGLSTDLDWAAFSCVVRDCQRLFNRPRWQEPRDPESAMDEWLEARAERAFEDGDERVYDLVDEMSDYDEMSDAA